MAASSRPPSRKAPARRQTPAPKARIGKAPGKPAAAAGRKSTPVPRRSRWRRGLAWTAAVGIWLVLVLGLVVAWYARDLPDVRRIAENTRQPSLQVVDAEGGRIAAYGELYGTALSVAELPPQLSQAVLAIEDRRFYSHFGLDPIGLSRAAVANLRAGRVVQGGSTITQQLAKNLFLTPERTLGRKVQELLLAFWLERKLSKDQILSLYLNRVYFGAGTYGVDAAARRYFGKPATELDLYESATLAGLLRAPSRYNPARNPDLAHARAVQVLAAMVSAGFIGAEDAVVVAEERGEPEPAPTGRGRYFADWVAGQVDGLVGSLDRDLIAETTLDPRLQRIAEEEVERLLAEAGADAGVSQAAVVILSPDGAVRALVGGRDYRGSQFNRAVQALRQPGSAFKPFVFLAAVERGAAPDDRRHDGPITVALPRGSWSPRNYGDRFYGEVTLREAFARSLNSVAVQLLQEQGAEAAVERARRLGISSRMEALPSLALGVSEVTLLELTAAYAPFANGGYGVWPYGIRSLTTPSGQILHRREGQGLGRVIAPAAHAAMLDMLQAGVSWGTGRGADPGRPAGGKTGTTQEFRDAWFVGFTAELVVGVWLGNDDGTPMRQVSGGGLPARLWRAVVTRALEGQPPQPLPLHAPVPQPQPETREARAPDSGGFLDRLIESITSGGGESGGAARSGSGGSDEALRRMEQQQYDRVHNR